MSTDPTQHVLVLGSKPDAPMPAIRPVAIYTANGAAARVVEVEGPKPPVTCVAAARAIDLPHDREAILSAAPGCIVIRKGNEQAEREIRPRLPETRFVQLTLKQQWAFQRRMVGWRLLAAELHYDRRLKARWSRLNKYLRKGFAALGASTGLYAVLLAADEHPEARIILAGIGIQPGGHFYAHDGKPHGNRANVDAWLFPRLPEALRARLSTTDETLARVAGIPRWDDRR